MPAVTRRDFLKAGTAGAAALAAAGLGFDVALAQSTKVKQTLRIVGAKELHSICPYCAVGCSLVAYTRQNTDGSVQLLQIEGDPDSPVNEGRLCPKGATAMQLAVSPRRVANPQYRAAGATGWATVTWDFALTKIAQNIKASRDARRKRQHRQPHRRHRLRGRRHIQLGGRLLRRQADAWPGTGIPRAAGQGLTRPHGGQFGRHVRKGSDDEPLARHQER
jgi:formate dehydrogenase major subunit